MVLLGIISTNEAEKMSVKRSRTEEYFTFHLVLEFLGRWITIYAKQCIKMQEELVKQGKTIKKLEKLLAKQANILANLEKKK